MHMPLICLVHINERENYLFHTDAAKLASVLRRFDMLSCIIMAVIT